MADYRDDWRGGYERDRFRSNSSGGEEDRWRSSRGERGIVDRAGDEFRSWLGDEEAERRRERDTRSDERGGDWRGASGGSYERVHRSNYADHSGSHWDESYRRWRQEQIDQMDREYEEFRRERHQQFESDFHSWRQGRQQPTGLTGFADQVRQEQGAQRETNAQLGSAEAGATTTSGGTASASHSSTGSSNDA